MKKQFYLRFLACFLLALSLAGNLGAEQLQIFQGILPTASGPGMDVQLYLYSDGESFVRYSYLKGEGEWYTEFGTWVVSGNKLDVKALFEDGISFSFLREGKYLFPRHPKTGLKLYDGLPRAALVQISN